VFDERFDAAAAKVLTAVCGSVSPDAVLTGVSAAVWTCTQLSHDAHVPLGFLVPWGQGPLVLALIAAEREIDEIALKAGSLVG